MKYRVVKFLISGGSAAFVEYIIFVCLSLYLGPTLIIISQTVSFLAGFAVSFILNKEWVFGSAGDTKKQLSKYCLLAGINLVLSNLALWIFIDQLDINHFIAKFIVMGMVALWNYALFARFIFKPRATEPISRV